MLNKIVILTVPPTRLTERRRWERHRPVPEQRRALAYRQLATGVLAVSILYSIAVVLGLGVPSLRSYPASLSTGAAVVMDLGLLSLAVMHFHFVQRPCAFLGVQQLRRSRAMFSQDRLLVSALLLAFFFAWEPLPNPVWTIGAPLQLMLLQAGCYAGWLLLLLSAALAEVPPFLRLALRTGVLRCSGFATRVARAGIVGGLLLVEWCTAQMNLGHLLFAGALTAYLGVAFLLYRRSVNTAFLRASAVNRPVRPARG